MKLVILILTHIYHTCKVSTRYSLSAEITSLLDGDIPAGNLSI